MGRFRGYWWAPDGQSLLDARVDNSPVQRWWITDPADPARPPRAVRYPAAGTANADVTLHVLGLDGSKTEVTWDRGAYEYLATADWDARGPLLSVQSRDQRTVLVLAADAATGQATLLHVERDDAWVELAPGTPARTSAGDLVTVSDRDGSRRLVVSGTAVTPDGLHVGSVCGADGEAVYFTATDERDPTERHLWRYDPGRGLSRCSAGPGVHDGAAAGGTVVMLSRTEGGHVAAVAWRDGTRAAIASLEAEPLVKPRVTWLTLGARALRAALLLPSWYRPGTRLPVLLSPYGGPAMQRVVRVRDAAFCEDQWWAEQGFAVLVTDGRGTPGRGPEWSKAVFGDTLSAPLDDQVDALDAACASFPDLDRGRVAIHGWSYGGALAAIAVIRRPDVFHAAVSGAAPHDQRLYDTHWRERFLGLPQQNPEGYDRSSTMTGAASLTRPLLLVHGMADDNVVVAHTLRMSAALLAAGRPHQLLPLSGTTHTPTDASTVSQPLRHELAFLAGSLGVARPDAGELTGRSGPQVGDGAVGGAHPLGDDAPRGLRHLGLGQPPEPVAGDRGHDREDAPRDVKPARRRVVVRRVIQGLKAAQHGLIGRHTVGVELLQRPLGEHRPRSDRVEPVLLRGTARRVVAEDPPGPGARVVAGEERDEHQPLQGEAEVPADHRREPVGLALK
jgi:dipeptidyl-peptidase-4